MSQVTKNCAKQERNDRETDEEGNSPGAGGKLLPGQHQCQGRPERGTEHVGHQLAGICREP